MSIRAKAVLISALHAAAFAAAYYHLITGGWLTNNYRLDDPNVVNLVLAIFEPIAFLSVAVYWFSRKPLAYRLIFILAIVQVVIGLGFLVFILLFVMLWHPRMM